MSKNANAGELRTAVFFKKIVRTTNKNGFQEETQENVFSDAAAPVMCKWVNAHGSEVFSAMQQQLKDPATLTLRYSPALDDETLILYREQDPEPFEVISIDNVEQQNTWLEIKVQRRVPAR